VCYRHTGRETYIRCQRCDRPICPDCMNPAAVGFQCPECVRSGAKQTRSGRTAYGGQRSANPALTSQVLIALNALVWLLIAVTGWTKSEWIYRLALVPDGLCRADSGGYLPVDERTCAPLPNVTWIDGVATGAPWQLVSSVFTHVDLWHIGFNMLALWVLGPQLELAIGRLRFLALYLGSGLCGSALVYWLAGAHSATLGASGAIFGLMGALLVIVVRVRGDVQNLLVWIGINAAITVIGRDFISWQGHLGGFLGGLALMGVIAYSPRQQRGVWQLAGFVLVGVAVAAAIGVRTLQLA
jgi:membrane associated rhomboid family serine protease